MQKMPPYISNADIAWQESGAPYSNHFQDIYFSRQGGLEETEHVFIAANQLRERWTLKDQALAAGDRAAQTHFTITELGFGTGLNFLSCWQAWWTLAPRHLRLHYIACEKYPLQSEALARALSHWNTLEEFSVKLLAQYPDHSAGFHRLIFSTGGGRADITLDLYFGDALHTLSALAAPPDGVVDAWFLDGFAPRTNPDLWNGELFRTLNLLSRSTATLSTYSVAGLVVKTLQDNGFSTEKTAGFGQKRQMLQGRLSQRLKNFPSASNDTRSWLTPLWPTRTPKHVIVIGAGMAGCSTAWSLAQRGCHVTVLEQNDDIAKGASGNRQAVLQCRLNNAINAAWQFNLQAFLHAARHYTQMQENHPEIDWHACGVLNLDTSFQSRQEKCPEVRLQLYSPKVVRSVDQGEASMIAGVQLDGGGNFIPLGGWLKPSALCRAWLQHPLIAVRCGSHVAQISNSQGEWHAQDRAGATLESADAVVIANSVAASQFVQTEALPLIPLRGQVTYVKAGSISGPLQAVVCGRSYISPCDAGEHSTGASYSKDVRDLSMSEKENAENIEGIVGHLPSGALPAEAITGGRVSVRAGTGDRIPMVGPAVDVDALQTLYRALSQRERKSPTTVAPYHAGLYLNVGHGSHGLSNTPLAAEYLASVMFREPLPLQREVIDCLHPARFMLRMLRRERAQR